MLFPLDGFGPMKQAERKRTEEQLAGVSRSMDKLDAQTIGYLTAQRTNGIFELLEVIVTKVTDTDNGQTIGALCLAVPFVETSEKAMSDFSQGGIQSGIWLDDKLHSKTIPEADRAVFSKLILSRMKSAGQPQDVLKVTLGGVPREVFFKLLNPGSPFPPAYQVSLYSLAVRSRRSANCAGRSSHSVARLSTVSVFSLFLAHGLSIPLRELVQGNKAVRGGDFSVSNT